tara:strand:+ start:2017 stop:2154 length:138 start_codon:yes stop_codon:yes gene_type:complete
MGRYGVKLCHLSHAFFAYRLWFAPLLHRPHMTITGNEALKWKAEK